MEHGQASSPNTASTHIAPKLFVAGIMLGAVGTVFANSKNGKQLMQNTKLKLRTMFGKKNYVADTVKQEAERGADKLTKYFDQFTN